VVFNTVELEAVWRRRKTLFLLDQGREPPSIKDFPSLYRFGMKPPPAEFFP